MAQRGVPRKQSETPDEYADRLLGSSEATRLALRDGTGTIHALSDCYDDVRYGEAQPDEASLKKLATDSEALIQRLSAKP